MAQNTTERIKLLEQGGGESQRRLGGELSPTILLSLLADIRQERRVATLLVAREAREKCFYFTVGAIRMVTVGDERGLRLEDVLLRDRLISPEALAAAEKKRLKSAVPLREDGAEAAGATPKRKVRPLLEEVLSADELVPRDRIHSAVAEVVRWELEEIFFWAGSNFTFTLGTPKVDIYQSQVNAHKMSFGVYKLLEELELEAKSWSPRQQRFYNGALLKPGDAPPPNDPLAQLMAAKVTPDGLLLSEAVFATREAQRRPFEAAWVLADMIEARSLTAEIGRVRALSQKEMEAKVGHLEAWVGRLLTGIEVNKALARLYEDMAQPERAIEYRRNIAEHLYEDGYYDEALGEFQKIIEVSDKDFPTYERILEILERLKRGPELLTMARRYGNVLSLNGLFNRAKEAWNYVVNLAPTDVDARRQLADAHLQLEDLPAAERELMAVAKLVERDGAEEEVQAAYVDLLKVNPENKEVMQRYEVRLGVSRARFLRRGFVAAALAVLAVGAYFTATVNLASIEYNRARDLAQRNADEGRHGDAIGALRDFAEGQSFGFTKHGAEQYQAFLQKDGEAAKAEMFRSAMGRVRFLLGERRVPEAREALKTLNLELQLLNEVYFPERSGWLKECASLLSRCEEQIKDGDRRLRAARLAKSNGSFREAHSNYRQLAENFSWLDEVASEEVPISIETRPPGAKIYNRGTYERDSPRPNEPPSIVRVRINEPLDLAADLPGYERTAAGPEQRWDWPIVISLKKKVAWSHALTGPADAGPVTDGLHIFAGDRGGGVCALETKDGAVRALWSRSLGLEGDVADLVASGGALAARIGSGEVLSLDPASGSAIWTKPSAAVAPALLRVGARQVLVVFAAADDRLVACPSDKAQLAWELSFNAGITGAPLTLGNRLLVGDARGQLHLVDARGRRRGSPITLVKEEPVPRGLALSSSEAVYAFESGRVCFVRASDDKVTLSESIPINFALAFPPTRAGEKVFITAADDAGTILAFRLSSRRPDLSIKLGAPITGPATAGEGGLYVPTRRGLIARSTEDLSPLWQLATDEALTAAPLVLRDQVILATRGRGVLSVVE